MIFGKHIHASFRINCINFGEPLSFDLAPPSGLIVLVSYTLVDEQMMNKEKE